MSRKGFPKAVAPIGEQRTGALDVPSQPRQIVTPYLDSYGAVTYLSLPSLDALYAHIKKNRLPVLRCGGDLRFDVRELDAWLRGTTAIELARGRKRSAWVHASDCSDSSGGAAMRRAGE